ncbi:hypothetical protein [Nonomuraea sp. NPDC003709]|uniref:TRADD-N-associated membrane domain-containing protein n=1 Tax=Nonomuraea sp. NPDC003709 TaxID=3154450 RepID=UPI0033BE1EA2
MTAQRFELLPQVGTAEVTLVIAAFAILVAALCVVYVGRTQARRLQEEFGHAEHVFARLHRDPDDEEIRLSARRKSRTDTDPEIVQTEGMTAISRTARQEAEIYLQHHLIALKHHAAYQQASLWSGLLGFSVILVGGALTYFVGLDVGAVTALAGVIPVAAGRLLFRQANVVGARAAGNLRGLEDSVRRFGALQGGWRRPSDAQPHVRGDRHAPALPDQRTGDVVAGPGEGGRERQEERGELTLSSPHHPKVLLGESTILRVDGAVASCVLEHLRSLGELPAFLQHAADVERREWDHRGKHGELAVA